MAESLEPHGFQQVPFNEKADLYVINSCTVTGKADYTSRQMVRRALRNNPKAKILVTGCYAELEIESLKTLSEDIYVIGNKDKKNVPEIVCDLFRITPGNSPAAQRISRMDGYSRAFIKIQEGCTEGCTYCVIWKARGRPWSRDPGEIIDEINTLYENGYREVVLTGVHIGKYKNKMTLTELLKAILDNTSMPRVRLSSLKPNECKSELLELVSSQKRICPHIHLPIQSGDDAILRMMGRKYKAAAIGTLVEALADLREGITIGADFIVGFPGEDDMAFANTYALIEEHPIHHIHVFSYSDRPGAPAASLPGKVEPSRKAERSRKLRRLGKIKRKEHMRQFIGKTLDVIVENRVRANHLTGISGNYLNVEFQGGDELRGMLIEIDISGLGEDALIGTTQRLVVQKTVD